MFDAIAYGLSTVWKGAVSCCRRRKPKNDPQLYQPLPDSDIFVEKIPLSQSQQDKSARRPASRGKCQRVMGSAVQTLNLLSERLANPTAYTLKSVASVMLIANYVLIALVNDQVVTPEEYGESMSDVFNKVLYAAYAALLLGTVGRIKHTGVFLEWLERNIIWFFINANERQKGDVFGLYIAGAATLMTTVAMFYDVDNGLQLTFDRQVMENRAGGNRLPVGSGLQIGGESSCNTRMPGRVILRGWNMGTLGLLGYFSGYKTFDFFFPVLTDNQVRLVAGAVGAATLMGSFMELASGLDRNPDVLSSKKIKAATLCAMIRQGILTSQQVLVVTEHLVEKFFPELISELDLLQYSQLAVALWALTAGLSLNAAIDTIKLARQFFINAGSEMVATLPNLPDDEVTEEKLNQQVTALARGELNPSAVRKKPNWWNMFTAPAAASVHREIQLTPSLPALTN